MSLLKKSGIVIVGTVLGAGLSYLLNPLLIGPRLGTEGIALIGTFLSLSCIFSALHMPVSTIVVRFVSELFAHHKLAEAGALIVHLQKKIGLYGFLAVLLLLPATGPIMSYLRLDSRLPVLFALALAYVYLIERIFIASFQGLQRFHYQTFTMILDPAVRLAIGGSLVMLGLGATGVMTAYLAGHLAVLILSGFFLRDLLTQVKTTPVTLPADLWRFSLPAACYAFFAAFAVSMDNLFAKHFFQGHEAGIFIAAMTLARISSILIYPVSAVAYSLMSHAASQKKRTLPIFLQAAAALTACFALMAAAFFLIPGEIIRMTYGKAFTETVPLLGLAGLAFIPVGYTLLLANFNLAKKQFRFVYGLVAGIFVHAALLMTFHHSLTAFMKANIAGGAALLLFSLAGTSWDLFSKRPSAAGDILPIPVPEP